MNYNKNAVTLHPTITEIFSNLMSGGLVIDFSKPITVKIPIIMEKQNKKDSDFICISFTGDQMKVIKNFIDVKEYNDEI